jgi:hypothetical protein
MSHERILDGSVMAMMSMQHRQTALGVPSNEERSLIARYDNSWDDRRRKVRTRLMSPEMSELNRSMIERVETALGESRFGDRPKLAVKKSKKRKVSPSLELIKGQFNKRLAQVRNARVKARLAGRAI